MSHDLYEDGRYLAHNPTWHEEDSPWKADHIDRLLKKNHVEPATVAEIGCGAGEILNRMALARGEQVHFTGYELSPQAIQIAMPKQRPNLRFFHGDMLTQTDATFDLVMAIDVFEHVDDYLGFLRQLRTKGHYKVFHIPLDLSVQSVWRCAPIMKLRSSVGHIHYFTKETALATLHDAGYQVMDHVYTQSALDLPNRGWKANAMKLPRKLLFAMSPDVAVRLLGGFSLLVLAK